MKSLSVSSDEVIVDDYKEYTRARREAARQTGLEISIFPEFCPYEIEQVIKDWLPNI